MRSTRRGESRKMKMRKTAWRQESAGSVLQELVMAFKKQGMVFTQKKIKRSRDIQHMSRESLILSH